MPEFLAVLPNLSIGVVAILGLIFVVIRFNQTLDERSDKHERAMLEREHALRNFETSVRETFASHLSQASIALAENTKVLARVIRHLDGDK